MRGKLFGRDSEIRQLRSHFDAVASDHAEGGGAGPRLVVLVADTGVGKSRLIQELYHRLTDDAVWNEYKYWPQDFGGADDRLRVTPDMTREHTMSGPPRFLWLGARWTAPEHRNVDARSALPDLRSEFSAHKAILENHQDLFTKALRSARGVTPGSMAKEALGYLADELPLGGVMLRAATGILDAVRSALGRDRTAFEERERQLNSMVQELQECFRSTLEGQGALPIVLWLDDAQWIDGDTQRLVRRLWKEGQQKRWPLLIIVTHWEREWRELLQLPEDGRSETLAGYRGESGFAEVYLGPAGDDALRALVAERLPGLSRRHQDLLLERAGGNFLSMVENLGDLARRPVHFDSGDLTRGLSRIGEKFVKSWQTERSRRVEQRFLALDTTVQHLLGWSSRLGQRFLLGVVTEFATRVEVASENDANQLMGWCVDPGAILGASSTLTREFRDKAFREAARCYFESYLGHHEELLHSVLREHLTNWVNASYDGTGKLLTGEGEAPEASMAGLWVSEQRGELRALLEMTRAELPLLDASNWEGEDAQAALRALVLSVGNDALEQLWPRAREYGHRLEVVDWQKLPETVLSLDERGVLAHRCEIAGLTQLAYRVRESVIISMLRCAEVDAATLCVTLLQQAGSARSLGDLSDAESLVLDALKVITQLRKTEDTAEVRFLAMASLLEVGDIAYGRCDLESARGYYEGSLEIARQLREEFGTLESCRVVTTALLRLGDIERELGNLAAAHLFYTEGQEITGELPGLLGTPGVLSDMSICLLRLAGIEREFGNLSEAHFFCAESLEIDRQLRDLLGTPESHRAVSTSLVLLGDIERERGNLSSALLCYTESVKIARQLVEELGTPGSRRDVLVISQHIGDIERELGNLSSALSRYTEGLKGARQLVEELGTPESRDDVLSFVVRIGDIERERGRLSSALSCYEEGLEIARQLLVELQTPEMALTLLLLVECVEGIRNSLASLPAGDPPPED